MQRNGKLIVIRLAVGRIVRYQDTFCFPSVNARFLSGGSLHYEILFASRNLLTSDNSTIFNHVEKKIKQLFEALDKKEPQRSLNSYDKRACNDTRMFLFSFLECEDRLEKNIDYSAWKTSFLVRAKDNRLSNENLNPNQERLILYISP